MFLSKRTYFLGLTLIIAFTLAACGGTGITSETPRTDALTLEMDYEGKNYIDDGIGVAILASCEDGDTAEFIVGEEQIRVRFLGIDTPEASHYYEAWGYQASQFACERLTNAEEIVLERDWDGVLRDTYLRYLAFIWVDGRLLNLELVEMGLAEQRGAITLKYGVDIFEADMDAREAGLKMFGENDPLFDPDAQTEALNIETIVLNYEDYVFKPVTVEGVITAKLADHLFIEDGGFGIFIYTGHEDTTHLNVGDRIIFESFQVIYDLSRFSGVHLTNYDSERVTIIESNIEVEPVLKTISTIDEFDVGRLVRLENIVIKEIHIGYAGDFSLVVENEHGYSMIIHQHRFILSFNQVDPVIFTVGDTISVEGPLMLSPEGIQLMLTAEENIDIHE